jgi:hypothetical protein
MQRRGDSLNRGGGESLSEKPAVERRYVLDSHWIYPGDPLAIPAKPNVVPPEGQAPAAEAQPPAAETGSEAVAAAPETVEPAPSTGSTTPAMISLADAHDLYCSGWVDGKHEPSTLTIAGANAAKQRSALQAYTPRSLAGF